MSHNSHDSHSHHITPPLTYVKVFICLVVGMGLTIWWAQFARDHLPKEPWVSFLNNIVAMTIAVAKASLVIMYFMGVKYSTKLIRFYALLGFAWVGWIGLAFCDYATRAWEPVPGWEGRETVGYPTQMKVPTSNKTDVPKQLMQHSPYQP